MKKPALLRGFAHSSESNRDDRSRANLPMLRFYIKPQRVSFPPSFTYKKSLKNKTLRTLCPTAIESSRAGTTEPADAGLKTGGAAYRDVPKKCIRDNRGCSAHIINSGKVRRYSLGTTAPPPRRSEMCVWCPRSW